MKRTGFLAKLAVLPAFGALLASPMAPTVEKAAESAVEGDEWVAFGLSENGMIVSTFRRPGWPTLDELQDAAKAGMDRFEVWRDGGIHYQAPTIEGVLPRGWTSLEYAGHITR